MQFGDDLVNCSDEDVGERAKCIACEAVDALEQIVFGRLSVIGDDNDLDQCVELNLASACFGTNEVDLVIEVFGGPLHRVAVAVFEGSS